jgi:hypothetical protein
MAAPERARRSQESRGWTGLRRFGTRRRLREADGEGAVMLASRRLRILAARIAERAWESMAFAREVTVTYNLFRSDDLDELYCAVPEHRAVPRFVKAGAWSFEGKIREEGAPKAFDGSAAKVGVRFNGFHLFQGVRFR